MTLLSLRGPVTGLSPDGPPCNCRCRPKSTDFALPSHFRHDTAHTYTCSHPIRRRRSVACEQMFPSRRHSTLAQRTLDVLRLTRAFLLLEDDRDVDWEVDQDERAQALHPHRVALRRRLRGRRPGEPLPRPQACLCPIGARPFTAYASGRAAERRRAAQRRPV